MNYNKLPIIMRRYDFEEKMRVLQFYSRNFMTVTGIEIVPSQPHPWDLETFLLFATKYPEYQKKNFKGKNINAFIEIINSIREHQHPKILEYSGNIALLDLVLISHGSTQFDIQSYNIYKFYMFSYIYNILRVYF